MMVLYNFTNHGGKMPGYSIITAAPKLTLLAFLQTDHVTIIYPMDIYEGPAFCSWAFNL